ncbi:MAG TPA: plastocyanin/azurin family copper-binding protein [Gemmatimonadales bacterium]|nr:plastocyanin/azurin family copper-binding protein [Gemmatimonadales bacterium]
MSRLALLASAAALTCLASCSDSNAPDNNAPPPATASVTATTGQKFTPATVRVATGGTVTWVFQSLGHNVTFDATAGAPEDIPGVNSNTSIARTFSTNGTFAYHCTIHSGMTGTVQVSSATATVASSPSTSNNPPMNSDGNGAPPTGY